jgi:anaerobic carbon-monoxide dehydrogenase iron sulfur subunit
MGRVLVFHRDHCLACRSCELACSVAHSESGELEAAIAEKCPPVRRVVVARTPLPYGRGSDPSRDGVPSGPGAIAPDGVEALRCEQCLEPLCAFACKSGALRRDPLTGRVAYAPIRPETAWCAAMSAGTWPRRPALRLAPPAH